MDEKESIFKSIKKLIGIADDNKDFDTDLFIHINSVFSILTQLGVGPKDGFEIASGNELWSDFISDNKKLKMASSFIYFKVKLLFDPPTNSALLQSINDQIKELEFRLTVYESESL